MKKIISWLRESNRSKHLAYGALVGLCANDWYCAECVGVGVAGALEFKDKQWGGKWDWIDFALTVLGVNVGFLLRWIVL